MRKIVRLIKGLVFVASINVLRRLGPDPNVLNDYLNLQSYPGNCDRPNCLDSLASHQKWFYITVSIACLRRLGLLCRLLCCYYVAKEPCLATTFHERNDSRVVPFHLRAINMPLVLLLTHTTLISSCLPSKFCSSRRQTWNELLVTSSVQMRAAS